MSQFPRHHETSSSQLSELPAQPVSSEEAQHVAGGLNPQPLPPKVYLPVSYWYTPYLAQYSQY